MSPNQKHFVPMAYVAVVGTGRLHYVHVRGLNPQPLNPPLNPEPLTLNPTPKTVNPKLVFSVFG